MEINGSGNTWTFDSATPTETGQVGEIPYWEFSLAAHESITYSATFTIDTVGCPTPAEGVAPEIIFRGAQDSGATALFTCMDCP